MNINSSLVMFSLPILPIAGIVPQVESWGFRSRRCYKDHRCVVWRKSVPGLADTMVMYRYLLPRLLFSIHL